MYRALLAAVTLMWINDAMAVEAASLIVREAKGEVQVTAAGHEERAKVGDVFSPPVQFRTGADGAALIAQGDTTVRIAPSSVIAIPLGASPSTIDKVIQQVGGALYNVKSRNGKPFSVETPYLTSVVKGTLFSITVQGDEATVALLEGSLEVGGRGADTVMLGSGDTARLKSGGNRVSVERARDARVPAAGAATRSANAVVERAAPAAGANEVDSDIARVSAAFQSRATIAASQPATVTPSPDSNEPASTAPTDPAAVIPAGSPNPVTTTPVVPAPVITIPAVTIPVVSTPVVPTDDRNNGHGNDSDGVDDSNPGHRKGKKH
jgi:hypothetical protein